MLLYIYNPNLNPNPDPLLSPAQGAVMESGDVTEKEPEFHRSWKLLLYAVPALCYCVNNNLGVALQRFMDPATYMVLGNFKIVTTAILFRVSI